MSQWFQLWKHVKLMKSGGLPNAIRRYVRGIDVERFRERLDVKSRRLTLRSATGTA